MEIGGRNLAVSAVGGRQMFDIESASARVGLATRRLLSPHTNFDVIHLLEPECRADGTSRGVPPPGGSRTAR
jgi:hypothetical protein